MSRQMLIVSYDVSDNRRRYRLDRLLQGYGERVQKSVFELFVDLADRAVLEREIAAIIDPKADGVRVYPLCTVDRPGVRTAGAAVHARDWDYLLV